jgi:hypothetical protein
MFPLRAEETYGESETASSSKVSDGKPETNDGKPETNEGKPETNDGKPETIELDNSPVCDSAFGNSLQDNVNNNTKPGKDYTPFPHLAVDEYQDLCARIFSILNNVSALSNIVKTRIITDKDVVYRANDKYILDEIVCLLPNWLAQEFVKLWNSLRNNDRFQSIIHPVRAETASILDPNLSTRGLQIKNPDNSVLTKHFEEINSEWTLIGTSREHAKTCACGQTCSDQSIICTLSDDCEFEVFCSEGCLFQHTYTVHA